MLDLSIGGPSWAGWTFARWGRAKEWRLHAPDGSNYTAWELLDVRAAALDLDYLRARVGELEDYAAADALHFGPMDAAALKSAAEIVLRAARQFAVGRVR